ncbi:MAG: hypothetical protein ACE5H4_16040 [Candidatus Thorarchaeota archaeon]
MLKTSLHDLMVGNVRNQIATGGSDLFFDVDAMSSKPSSVLVADLLQARRSRFIGFAVPFLDGEHSPPLWTTTYGLNIIRKLDSVNRDSDRHQGLHPQEELEQSLRLALLDLGVDDTHRSDDHGTFPEPAMSERLRLLADALTNRFNEGVSRP